MIINLAIVEDDINQAQLLEKHLINYASQKALSFKINLYSHAVALIEDYTANFDIIFMDIQLPYLNGMDAARTIRDLDKEVIIIFITNLVQYAVQGYEVEALDYIVKPIEYYDFALKVSRAIQRIENKPQHDILIPTGSGFRKISARSIRYVETERHHVIYHTVNGEFRQYATISSVEKKLQNYDFFRCNNCYLVNLAYVQKIQGYTVLLDGVNLRISQPRKKAFVERLLDYARKKNV